MNRPGRILSLALSSVALPLSALAVLAGEGPVGEDVVPVHVHCGGISEDSLQHALAANKARAALVIEFAGPCQEDVQIERDDVRIQGIGHDAAVVGSITVTGARRVALRDFVVRDSDLYGITAQHGAAIRLDRVHVEDSYASGLLLLASTAHAVDCTFSRNGLGGIDLRSNSTLLLEGWTDATQNIVGAVLTGASHVETIDIGGLNVDSNSLGLLAANSSVELSGVEASDNFYGVILAGQTTASIYGLTANSNVVGVSVEEASHLRLAQSQVRFNDLGVFVDNGELVLSDSLAQINDLDVALEFGARATFDDSEVGTLSCDGTALSRGDYSCGAAVQLADGPVRSDPRQLLPDWFWTTGEAPRRPAPPSVRAPVDAPAAERTRSATRVAVW